MESFGKFQDKKRTTSEAAVCMELCQLLGETLIVFNKTSTCFHSKWIEHYSVAMTLFTALTNFCFNSQKVAKCGCSVAWKMKKICSGDLIVTPRAWTEPCNQSGPVMSPGLRWSIFLSYYRFRELDKCLPIFHAEKQIPVVVISCDHVTIIWVRYHLIVKNFH